MELPCLVLLLFNAKFVYVCLFLYIVTPTNHMATTFYLLIYISSKGTDIVLLSPTGEYGINQHYV